jgi:hypothetical protein
LESGYGSDGKPGEAMNRWLQEVLDMVKAGGMKGGKHWGREGRALA